MGNCYFLSRGSLGLYCCTNIYLQSSLFVMASAENNLDFLQKVSRTLLEQSILCVSEYMSMYLQSTQMAKCIAVSFDLRLWLQTNSSLSLCRDNSVSPMTLERRTKKRERKCRICRLHQFVWWVNHNLVINVLNPFSRPPVCVKSLFVSDAPLSVEMIIIFSFL